MSELDAFRADVEAFIEKHGLSPTRFGREAVGDAMFVSQLRSGREPRSSVRERVKAFMRNAAQAAEAA